MGKRLVLVMCLVVVVLAGVGVYFGLRIMLPIKPHEPYFGEKEDRIGKIHWSFGYLFPVYLRAYEKEDRIFVQVVYRDEKNQIRIISVEMGSKGALVPVKSPGGWINTPQGVADFQKGYRIGQRLKIGYYRNVIRRQERGYLDVLSMDDVVTIKYCQEYPRDCEIAKYVSEHKEDYWNFKLSGKFDKTVDFKAISMEPL